MPTPPLKRLACDRCHAKKIRCVVRIQEKACTRCVKQNLSCIFSPPAKTGRPPHARARHASQSSIPTISVCAALPSPSADRQRSLPSPRPRTAGCDARYATYPLSTSSGFDTTFTYSTDTFDFNIATSPQAELDTLFRNFESTGLLTPTDTDQSLDQKWTPIDLAGTSFCGVETSPTPSMMTPQLPPFSITQNNFTLSETYKVSKVFTPCRMCRRLDGALWLTCRVTL